MSKPIKKIKLIPKPKHSEQVKDSYGLKLEVISESKIKVRLKNGNECVLDKSEYEVL